MRFIILAVLLLSGCSAAQTTGALSTPAGTLFCAVQLAGGGAMVVSLIDAAASSAAPTAAPVAVIATGAAKAVVDQDCANAGKSMGGTGVAVSPPANPDSAPKVAVVAATAVK